jgi:hypothetical protein
LAAPEIKMVDWKKYYKDNLTSFLMVRHPFKRLVSAYRDKLERTHITVNDVEDPKSDFYYKRYGKKIVAQFRKKAIEKFGLEFIR